MGPSVTWVPGLPTHAAVQVHEQHQPLEDWQLDGITRSPYTQLVEGLVRVCQLRVLQKYERGDFEPDGGVRHLNQKLPHQISPLIPCVQQERQSI